MEKKNSNIALWIGCGLSIVCSIILFVMVLSDGNKKEKETKDVAKTEKKNKTLSSSGLKVAYINTDTIMAKYQMALDMEAELQAYQKNLQNELESKARKFQSDYENYLKNGASLTLTQQKQTEQDLTKRQQELPQLEQQMMMNLQERQASDNKKMLDAIYAFIKRDFEQKGFDDAMVNPENSYKESGKTLIKNELMQLFEQVRLKYRNDLRLLQVQIDNMEKQGLPVQAANLYARKETYEEHMRKIDEMEKKIESQEECMMSPIFTYERGFLKGLAAKSELILNINGQGE
jgi:Skp family chaperone for outer membrane proteins